MSSGFFIFSFMSNGFFIFFIIIIILFNYFIQKNGKRRNVWSMILRMPDQASRIFFERIIKNRHVNITMRTLDIWCTTYNLKTETQINHVIINAKFQSIRIFITWSSFFYCLAMFSDFVCIGMLLILKYIAQNRHPNRSV